MARTIENIINLFRDIVRKERGVFLTYEQICEFLDAGQLDALNDYFKLYAIDQVIHDALTPFRVYQSFTSTSGGGVTYEADYLHLLAGVYTIVGSDVCPVRFVQTDEYPIAISSQLRPVALATPIGMDTATGFQLYPATTHTGFYNYLRRPATPVFGYTQVGRVITYDSGTSTQLEWGDNYIDNIIAKALKYASVDMNEDGIYTFAQNQDKETQ